MTTLLRQRAGLGTWLSDSKDRNWESRRLASTWSKSSLSDCGSSVTLDTLINLVNLVNLSCSLLPYISFCSQLVSQQAPSNEKAISPISSACYQAQHGTQTRLEETEWCIRVLRPCTFRQSMLARRALCLGPCLFMLESGWLLYSVGCITDNAKLCWPLWNLTSESENPPLRAAMRVHFQQLTIFFPLERSDFPKLLTGFQF